MTDLKLICAADLHLGRRPSRFPDSWGGRRVASAAGWDNLVDHAVAEAADAVLLAGDVIDRFNRSFEAWGPLDRGVAVLADAGIPVVAVAGNHDFDTLPELADEIAGGRLRVLGAGGTWERWTLEGEDGSPRLHVDGWSFPREHHPRDPTESYRFEAAGVPVIGLLHCDLDQRETPYGPVLSSTLRSRGPDLWILGHIHAPALHQATGSTPLLYPGSLQALHPGEAGARGAWILELGTGRPPSFEQVPLSSVHYARIDVDIEGCEEPGEVNARIRGALSDHVDAVVDRGGEYVRAARCRVRLTGRTGLHDRLEGIVEGLGDFDPGGSSELRLSVDPRVVLDTRSTLDLEERARRNDPSGDLARLLLSLGGDGEETTDRAEIDAAASVDAELLERASRAAARVARRSHYTGRGLPGLDTSPGSSLVADAVRRQAGRLLDALVEDREAG